MTKRKALRMDSITHEDVDPKSVLGQVILAKDRKALQAIARAKRQSRDDLRAMELWAAADFQAKGLTVDGRSDSLEVKERSSDGRDTGPEEGT